MFGKNLSRKSVASFVVELVIVFVGVYLAFLFSDYQEGLQDRAIRVKCYNSLILELGQLRQHLMSEDRTIQQHVAVVAEIEEGLRPDLPVMHLSYTYQASWRQPLLAHLTWYPALVREIESLNHAIQEGLAERAIPSLVESRNQLLEQRFHWPF